MITHNSNAVARRAFVILFASLLQFGCAGLVGPKPDGDIVYKDIPANLQPSQPIPNGPDQNYDLIQAKAAGHLREGRLDALNAMLEDAHRNKVRLYGGYWKTYAIYEGLQTAEPRMRMSDQQWKDHLHRLNSWKQQFPGSRWARLAIAETVTERAFNATNKAEAAAYIKTAKAELAEIENMGVVDVPQFYVVALRIGQFEGAPLDKQTKTFQTGVALDPSYYHLYSVMGHYLRPDFYGHGGDVGKFIFVNCTRVPEKEANILYFEYSSSVENAFGMGIWQLTGLRYEQARSGYLDLEKTYGADNYRKNMMMFMALAAGDRETAAKMMSEVDDHWDERVWPNADYFYAAKAMILNGFRPQTPPPVAPPSQNSSI